MAHSNSNSNSNLNRNKNRGQNQSQHNRNRNHKNGTAEKNFHSNHNSRASANTKNRVRNSINNNKISKGSSGGSRISNVNIRSVPPGSAYMHGFSAFTGFSNIPNMSNIAVSNAGAAVTYPGRLRKAGVNVRTNDLERQKFYNRRRVIVSGKELTTPLKKRSLAVARPKAATDVKIKVTTINVKKKTFPLSAIFYTIVVMGVSLLMMYSLMVLNEYTDEISKAKTRIAAAQKDESYLMFQLDTKNNLAEFEKRAIELGMIKEDSLPKKYVSLKNKDKVEILGGSEGIFTKIAEIIPQVFREGSSNPNVSEE